MSRPSPCRLGAALAPLLRGVALLGLAPFRRAAGRYRRSRPALVATGACAIFLVLLTVTVMQNNFYISNNNIARWVMIYKVHLGAATGVLIYLNEILHQKHMRTITEALCEVDAALLRLGVDIRYQLDVAVIWILVAVLFGMTVVTIITDFWAWGTELLLFRASLVAVFMIPNTTIVAVTYIFCGYVYIIKKRLTLINDQILGNILRKGSVQPHDMVAHVLTREMFARSCTHDIMTSKLLHHKLCSLFHQLGSAYSFPILNILVWSYCSIFIQLYSWFAAMYHDSTGINPRQAVHSSIVLSFIVMSTLSLIILTDACTRQVRLFSLQLLRMPQDTVAGGLIKIDMELITTFLGSTVTYLVILIQFDMATNV